MGHYEINISLLRQCLSSSIAVDEPVAGEDEEGPQPDVPQRQGSDLHCLPEDDEAVSVLLQVVDALSNSLGVAVPRES